MSICQFAHHAHTNGVHAENTALQGVASSFAEFTHKVKNSHLLVWNGVERTFYTIPVYVHTMVNHQQKFLLIH